MTSQHWNLELSQDSRLSKYSDNSFRSRTISFTKQYTHNVSFMVAVEKDEIKFPFRGYIIREGEGELQIQGRIQPTIQEDKHWHKKYNYFSSDEQKEEIISKILTILANLESIYTDT